MMCSSKFELAGYVIPICRPHKVSINFSLPMVLGHEGAGAVVEVGSEVTTLRAGNRVIGAWVTQCGQCYQCLHGRSHLCEAQAAFGTLRKLTRSGTEVSSMSGLGTMAEMISPTRRAS